VPIDNTLGNGLKRVVDGRKGNQRRSVSMDEYVVNELNWQLICFSKSMSIQLNN
jgi:hypothetical protein